MRLELQLGRASIARTLGGGTYPKAGRLVRELQGWDNQEDVEWGRLDGSERDPAEF